MGVDRPIELKSLEFLPQAAELILNVLFGFEDSTQVLLDCILVRSLGGEHIFFPGRSLNPGFVAANGQGGCFGVLLLIVARGNPLIDELSVQRSECIPVGLDLQFVADQRLVLLEEGVGDSWVMFGLLDETVEILQGHHGIQGRGCHAWEVFEALNELTGTLVAICVSIGTVDEESLSALEGIFLLVKLSELGVGDGQESPGKDF